MTITKRTRGLFRTLTPSSAFLLGLVSGLWIPDLDLLAIPILHHRSIITHSVLIPFLLGKFGGNRFSHLIVSGMYGGIAIHLSADALSAASGFGMVWFPWPIKEALGAASPVWLVINAGLGIWLMIRLAPNMKWIVLPAAIAVAASYALLNEAAFAPFVVFGALVSVVVWARRRSSRNADREQGDSGN